MATLDGKKMSPFRKRYFLYKELRKMQEKNQKSGQKSEIEDELNLSKE